MARSQEGLRSGVQILWRKESTLEQIVGELTRAEVIAACLPFGWIQARDVSDHMKGLIYQAARTKDKFQELWRRNSVIILVDLTT